MGGQMPKEGNLSILWLHLLFIKAIDAKEYKDKNYISRLFLEVLPEVWYQNVVQIITDNVVVMKSVRSIIEVRYLIMIQSHG